MMIMNRLSRLVSAVVALVAAAIVFSAPAAALSEREQQDVLRIQAYINAIKTFKTDFTQIAANGAVAKGTMYVSRPGRLRVEYKPPVKLRVFATPQWLIVEDCKVKEPQYLPLRSTPAGILIQPYIQLGGDIEVTEVKRDSRWITLRLVEAKAPGKGAINLVFQANPLQLIGWTLFDQQGVPTQVAFEKIETDVTLDPNLFGYISQCH